MLDWLEHTIMPPDTTVREQALAHQAQLTKPAGALGRLEQIAVQLAAMQGRLQPEINRIHVSLFAGDHGIAAEGVSAFPQPVTAQMVKNFIDGGAAASVLSGFLAAELEVIDTGIASPVADKRIIAASAGKGTANFLHQAAMNPQQLQQSLESGRAAALRAKQSGSDIFIGGEMGIANTTSATAVACALLSCEAKQLTGAGTGLNTAQIQHKAAVIEQALTHHRAVLNSPLTILQTLGGFEIAALTGAYIAAASARLPVVVDGFICTVAALQAVHINPGVKDWLLFSHCSDEQGHRHLLKALQVNPLLNLNLRLGEASGALTAVPLLQMACQLHNNMATFASAGISTE